MQLAMYVVRQQMLQYVLGYNATLKTSSSKTFSCKHDPIQKWLIYVKNNLELSSNA